tara:strand:- start:1465 stop:2430 length:966 start_codon:yes stop_codon:yes gene_type:complete
LIQDRNKTAETLTINFADNKFLAQLFGSHNFNLAYIEKELSVSLNTKGNSVTILGEKEPTTKATEVLKILYKQVKEGRDIGVAELESTIRGVDISSKDGNSFLRQSDQLIRTKKKEVFPQSANQAKLIKAIQSTDLCFALGPAGTGKTYLAAAKAIESLSTGAVDRIILSRPALEAGEQIGFLPGDMKEKVDPYLRPIYDALEDMIPRSQLEKKIESGQIEIAPLAFMRGRTLNDAFVILDEAQNTTVTQMKMFLTRLGHHSKMVITGDLSQIDLRSNIPSGLEDAMRRLPGIKGISFVKFNEIDVFRHPLVAKVVKAYDN